ncbi:Zinc knuckle CX2CX4HX4C [Sesbania bispinosa]|nr:Zinc knuckle CX2CX4HX4C [Sesbania bispinosa]
MGRALESHVFEIQGKGTYVRTLVEFNTSKPLLPSINVGSKKEVAFWVDFQFERLPQFCYKFGVIGHDEDSCTGEQNVEDEDRPRGPWMRAAQNGKLVKPEATQFKPRSQPPNAAQEERQRALAQELLEKLSSLTVQQKPSIEPDPSIAGVKSDATAPAAPRQSQEEPENSRALEVMIHTEDGTSLLLKDISNVQLSSQTTTRKWKRIREAKPTTTGKENSPTFEGSQKRKVDFVDDECEEV